MSTAARLLAPLSFHSLLSVQQLLMFISDLGLGLRLRHVHHPQDRLVHPGPVSHPQRGHGFTLRSSLKPSFKSRWKKMAPFCWDLESNLYFFKRQEIPKFPLPENLVVLFFNFKASLLIDRSSFEKIDIGIIQSQWYLQPILSVVFLVTVWLYSKEWMLAVRGQTFANFQSHNAQLF